MATVACEGWIWCAICKRIFFSEEEHDDYKERPITWSVIAEEEKEWL